MRKPLHWTVFRIQEEMLRQNLNINALSTRTGIARSTLYAWFAGDRTPTVILADQCLEALGLQLEVSKKKP